MNFNRVIIAGRLTRDPELRYTPANVAVCNFGLAINETYKTKGGGKKENVHFVEVEAWQSTGEAIAKYFTKGKPIHVEGKLTYQSWEDKDGKTRHTLKVTCENFQFVESRAKDGITNQQMSAGAPVAAGRMPEDDLDPPF